MQRLLFQSILTGVHTPRTTIVNTSTVLWKSRSRIAITINTQQYRYLSTHDSHSSISKTDTDLKNQEPHEDDEYGGFHMNRTYRRWHETAYSLIGAGMYCWIFWRIKQDGGQALGLSTPHYMDPIYDEPGTENDDLIYFDNQAQAGK